MTATRFPFLITDYELLLKDFLEFSLEIGYGGGVEKEADPGCLKKRFLKF